jgi:hypothetical protein
VIDIGKFGHAENLAISASRARRSDYLPPVFSTLRFYPFVKQCRFGANLRCAIGTALVLYADIYL